LWTEESTIVTINIPVFFHEIFNYFGLMISINLMDLTG